MNADCITQVLRRMTMLGFEAYEERAPPPLIKNETAAFLPSHSLGGSGPSHPLSLTKVRLQGILDGVSWG